MAGKFIKKIVGVVPWSLDKDGVHYEGVSLHTLEDIDPKRGMGKKCEKISMSKDKLNDAGFDPMPGQKVQVVYNSYGKVETLILVDDTDFDVGFDD